jgi:hypothetical protein
MKNPERYSTIISDSSCEISEYKDTILKDIQKNEFIHFLNKNNFDKKRVKLLTAIIFLNMSPLHINEFDVFLFMKSKKLFSELL